MVGLEDLVVDRVKHHGGDGNEYSISVYLIESGGECFFVSVFLGCVQERVEYVYVVGGSQAASVDGGCILVRAVRVDVQHIVVTLPDDNNLGAVMFVSIVPTVYDTISVDRDSIL